MIVQDLDLHKLAGSRGWDVAPMWSIAKRVDRKGYPDAELLSVYRDYGVIRKSDRDDNHNVESDDLSNYKYVKVGDLVLNKMKTWQGSLGVSAYDGIVSPAYFTCQLSPLVHGPYIHYLLRSKPYIAMYGALSKGIRIGQWDLPYEEFREIPVMLPPLDEQRRIASYLDSQVAILSRLISAKRLQIDQINDFRREERERLIFSPEVLCVPSSIRNSSELSDPFSRVLPFGWNRTKFRYVARPESLASGGIGNLLSVYLNEGVIPFSQGGEDRVHNPSEDMSKYQIVRSGHLVMNNQQAWRGSVGVSSLEGIISPAYHVYQLSASINPLYANLLFRSRPMVFLYEQVSRGVGNIQRNLDGSSLKNIPVVFPELESQLRIVKMVSSSSESLEAKLASITDSILKLEELRVSLITGAVTGAFDVTAGRSVA